MQGNLLTRSKYPTPKVDWTPNIRSVESSLHKIIKLNNILKTPPNKHIYDSTLQPNSRWQHLQPADTADCNVPAKVDWHTNGWGIESTLSELSKHTINNISKYKHKVDLVPQPKLVGPNLQNIESDSKNISPIHRNDLPLSPCRAGPRANRHLCWRGGVDGKETMGGRGTPAEPAPVGAVGGKVPPVPGAAPKGGPTSPPPLAPC